MPGHSASTTRILTTTTLFAFTALLFMGTVSAGPADDAAGFVRDTEDGSFDHCLRAYTPPAGPVGSRPVLPFTVCFGVDKGGCDAYVSHLWVMCLRS